MDCDTPADGLTEGASDGLALVSAEGEALALTALGALEGVSVNDAEEDCDELVNGFVVDNGVGGSDSSMVSVC